MGFSKWLRRLFRPTQSTVPAEARLSEEDLRALEDFLRAQIDPTKRSSSGHVPTYDELVAAAWANLAIENPEVTLEDARRAIAAAWPSGVIEHPDLPSKDTRRVVPADA
jgi:hypothetical protein